MSTAATPPGNDLQPDPLMEGQHAPELYRLSGATLAVGVGALVAGLVIGGWVSVVCYVVSALAILCAAYALIMGVGWFHLSRAIDRLSSKIAREQAASDGQCIVELRFQSSDDTRSVAGLLMDQINEAMGGSGECGQIDRTDNQFRVLAQGRDVDKVIDALRSVAATNPGWADRYLWVPDRVQPRMGTRINI